MRLGGIEPPTCWFVVRYSIQLRYNRISERTSSLWVCISSNIFWRDQLRLIRNRIWTYIRRWLRARKASICSILIYTPQIALKPSTCLMSRPFQTVLWGIRRLNPAKQWINLLRLRVSLVCSCLQQSRYSGLRWPLSERRARTATMIMHHRPPIEQSETW